jgi:hypothetical protein
MKTGSGPGTAEDVRVVQVVGARHLLDRDQIELCFGDDGALSEPAESDLEEIAVVVG